MVDSAVSAYALATEVCPHGNLFLAKHVYRIISSLTRYRKNTIIRRFDDRSCVRGRASISLFLFARGGKKLWTQSFDRSREILTGEFVIGELMTMDERRDFRQEMNPPRRRRLRTSSPRWKLDGGE